MPVVCLCSQCVCRHEGLWGNRRLTMASKGENCNKSNMWPLAYCLTSDEPSLKLLWACWFHTNPLHTPWGWSLYVFTMETCDVGIGGFKASFMLLWLFYPGLSVLPAMPSAFGRTGSFCHLLQQAQLPAQGKGRENTERLILYRSNSAEEFGWFQTPWEQRPPKTRFHTIQCVLWLFCF